MGGQSHRLIHAATASWPRAVVSRLNLCTALVDKIILNKENQEHHGVKLFVLPLPVRGSNEIVNRQQGEAIR